MTDAGARRSGAVRSAFVTGAIAKLLSIALALVTVGLVVRSVSVDSWGFIAALTGVIAIFGFLDFGVGNAMISTVAAAHSRGKDKEISAAVTNGLLFLVLVAALILALGAVVVLLLPSDALLTSKGVSANTARWGLLLFVASVALAGPASIGSRVCLGLQRGRENNVFALIATILTFLLVAAGWSAKGPPLYFLSVLLFSPVVVNLLQTGRYLIGRERIVLDLKGASVSRVIAQIPLGLPFTLLVLAGAISYQTDILVVSYVAGLAAASSYGLVLRLFTTLSALLGGGLQQMWASTAHALAGGDVAWVRRVFPRVLQVTSLLYLVGAFGIVIFGQAFIKLWAGSQTQVSLSLLVAFAAWSTYAFVMSQLSTLLNGAGKVWPQAIIAIVMASINLPLGIYLTHVIGATGPLVASLIAHILVVGIPTVMMVRAVLRVDAAAPVE